MQTDRRVKEEIKVTEGQSLRHLFLPLHERKTTFHAVGIPIGGANASPGRYMY